VIRIGIVGLGKLGKIHLEQLSSIAEFKVVALYDINTSLSMKVSESLGLAFHGFYEDFLNECEAVLIATPTSSHFEYAELAIRKGKHVFIEKPITHTLEEAKKIIELADEAGIIVQVGHVERFNPAFTAIKKRTIAPMFIESHRLAQFNVRGTDVSVVLDLMIHDIDIILSLVKANVKKIHASGVAVASDSIDIANARIEFDNGAVANLTASRISFKQMRKMRLFQHNEYISIDFLEKKVDVFKLTDDPNAFGIPLNEAQPDKKIQMEQIEVKETNAIKAELMAFKTAIETGVSPETDAHEAAKALELAQKVLYQIKRNYQLSE
jgi:predicted dehydrogenase